VTPPRYRCRACGNLTRFDVTTTRTTRAFHHYSVGGALVVEDEQVLAESVDEIGCRWCARGGTVEIIENPENGSDDAPQAGAGAPSTSQ
jgi:hypothetical protein